MPNQRTKRPWTARIAATLVGLLLVGAVVLATAPANWLARYLAERTQGRVLLADAHGTIWSGNAVLAIGSPFANVASDGSVSAVADDSAHLALPGRVVWTLEMVSTLAPVLHLTHDGVLLQPVDVRYANGDLELGAGAAVLPTAMLQLFGAPLNTLRPEGRAELRWARTLIDARGALIGAGTVRIGDLSLAVSPVKPLGDYRVNWSSNASGLTWRITTEHGPLELQGSGSVVERRARMRVTAHAAADTSPAVVAQLKTLLDTIGTHGGGEAMIEIGNNT